MLQSAAAAMAEMRARRIHAPFPGLQPFDDAALASAAEPRANAITRYSEWQKDRLAVMFGDPVSTHPNPLDHELDDLVSVSPIPVATLRHHLSLDLFATHARATGDGRGVVLKQRLRVETSMGQAFAEWGLHGVEMLRERGLSSDHRRCAVVLDRGCCCDCTRGLSYSVPSRRPHGSTRGCIGSRSSPGRSPQYHRCRLYRRRASRLSPSAQGSCYRHPTAPGCRRPVLRSRCSPGACATLRP
jgi:hypothetical protein